MQIHRISRNSRENKSKWIKNETPFSTLQAVLAMAVLAISAAPVENSAHEDTSNDDLQTAQQFYSGYNGFGGFGGFGGKCC